MAQFYNDILSLSDDEDKIEVERRLRVRKEQINYLVTLDDVDIITRFGL